MNTKHNTSNSNTEQAIRSFTPEAPQKTASANKTEDGLIIHEAKIITPQPYGVYALCKIFEHLQIN